MRGADARPVQFQRLAVVADDAVAAHPPADRGPAHLLESAGVTGLAHPQPQRGLLVRWHETAQQRRVRQPLLEQPHRRPRQGGALGGGAPFDVGQQDRRIPGPVDVSDLQVGDAVGDDAGVDAEQQPVGDHDFEVRKHRQRSLVEDSGDSSMAEDVDRHANCLSSLAAADRAECRQQPAEVLVRPRTRARMPPSGDGRQRMPMRGVGDIDLLSADRGQPLPFGLGVGRQRPPIRLNVEVPPRGQFQHPVAETAAGSCVTLHQGPSQRLQPVRARHPELRQLPAPQIGDAAGETLIGECSHHPVQPTHVVVDRASGIGTAVRVDQLHQPDGQIAHQPWGSAIP